MNPQSSSIRRVLHSWKDISSYAGRGVRTVQRYEVQLGFPIHRPAGSPRSAVLAFTDEVDAWMNRSPMRIPQAASAVSIDAIYIKAKVGRERAALMQKRIENTERLLVQLTKSMQRAQDRRSQFFSVLAPKVFPVR